MKYTNASDCAEALFHLDLDIFACQRLTGDAFEDNRPYLARVLRRRSRLAEELEVHKAGPNGKLFRPATTLLQFHRLQHTKMAYRDYCATLSDEHEIYFNDVVYAVAGMCLQRHDVVHEALWSVNPTVAQRGASFVVADMTGLNMLKALLDKTVDDPEIEG